MCPYFTLFSVELPTYGVMMMLGLLVAGGLGMVRARRMGRRWENAMVIYACAFGFGLVGASGLYMAVTYPPKVLLEMMLSGELFSGNHLGLVFYGGLLGAVPGAWLGARIAHACLSDYIPAMVPCIPLGHAFGRVGCLLAGCCYGVPTQLPIGIVYPEGPSSVPAGTPLFPVQLLESLMLIVIFGILVFYTHRPRLARRVVGLYFLLYSATRFCLENLRYDEIRGHLGPWSTSQWISVLIFLAGTILLSWRKAQRGRPEKTALCQMLG